MAVSKVILNGTILMNVTDKIVTALTLVSPNKYTATDGTNSYTLQLFSNGIKIISPQLTSSQTFRFEYSYNVPFLIYKSTGGWTEYSKIYKKVNGSWVEQASSTWATLFDTNTNYRKME